MKACIKPGQGCKFCSIFLRANSIKWNTKWKLFISNWIIKEPEIFVFFKAHVTFIMEMDLGRFYCVFFVMSNLLQLKEERHFWGPVCRKVMKVKIWEIQQNNQVGFLEPQFWMKRPREWCKRNVGKRKAKPEALPTIETPSRLKRRKHSKRKTESYFQLVDEHKKSIKYNFTWRADWVTWIILSQI